MEWELPEVALIMAVTCFIASIVLAIATPYLAWLVQWALRVFVWIFLGPLMALVDKFYIVHELGEDDDGSTAFFSDIRSQLTLKMSGAFRYVNTSCRNLMDSQRMRFERYRRYIRANFPLVAWVIQIVAMPIIRTLLWPLMGLNNRVSASKKMSEGGKPRAMRTQKNIAFSARVRTQMIFARTVREDTLKLKAMRRYRFGRFINATPKIGMCRFADIPLPESTATPFQSKVVKNVSIARFKGSKLIGSMIHQEVKECVPSSVYLSDLDSGCPEFEQKELNVIAEGSNDIDQHFLILDLVGIELKNVEGAFRKSDPFFEVRAISLDGNLTEQVYRSEHISNNLNPKWNSAKIDLLKLCGGNKDKQFRISVFDYEKSLTHKFMGAVVTTLNELIALETPIGNVAELKSIDTSKALILEKGAKRVATGKLIVSGATLLSSSLSDEFVSNEDKISSKVEARKTTRKQSSISAKFNFNRTSISTEVKRFDDSLLHLKNDFKQDKGVTMIVRFIGVDLKNVEGLFRKSDPFFEVYAASTDGDFTDLVYCSEFILNDLNPMWPSAKINMVKLCGGDMDRMFRICVFDYEKSLKHKFMGSVDTTLTTLISSEVSVAPDKNSIDTSRALILSRRVNGKDKASGKLIVCGLSLPGSRERTEAAILEEN